MPFLFAPKCAKIEVFYVKSGSGAKDMTKKIAFIGTGAMGGAILRAACQGVNPEQVFLTDWAQEKAEALARELGCHAISSNKAAAEAADIIFLCVKPQIGAQVLAEIAPILLESVKAGKPKVLCSILAGVTIQTMRKIVGESNYPIIRIMPNTPALIGKGLLLLSCDDAVSEADKNALSELVAPCGAAEWMSEKLLDQATAVSGCSPAFVYMFIEALADGGVSIGVPRAQAIQFAAQAVYGAAAMVMETGEHPGVLKDMVCSPGGSTIAGVAALEDGGFRRAVIQAVQQSAKRNAELGEIETT